MRKSSSFSVCIPAHNEENCITRTLDSVLDALKVTEARSGEIIICANACIDQTIERVRLWATGRGLGFRLHAIEGPAPAKADGFVTVFDTKKPGKPNAWNELKDRANGEILIFADADVLIERNAFALLLKALEENPGALAAGAVVFAPPGVGNALYRRTAIKMKEFARKPAPYINGPLYAIRRGAVESVPVGIIGEDAYLSMVVGPKNTLKVDGAVAWQVPPNTYGDYFRRRTRDNLSDMQLKSLYGGRYLAFRAATSDTRSKSERLSTLTCSERVFKRITFPQIWLLKLLDKMAEKKARAMFRAGDIRWYTISSTKTAANGDK